MKAFVVPGAILVVLALLLAVTIAGCAKPAAKTPTMPPMEMVSPATAPGEKTPTPATEEKPAATNIVYTCPMHPEVHSDKPGKCPKCGMDLVPEKGVTTPSTPPMEKAPAEPAGTTAPEGK